MAMFLWLEEHSRLYFVVLFISVSSQVGWLNFYSHPFATRGYNYIFHKAENTINTDQDRIKLFLEAKKPECFILIIYHFGRLPFWLSSQTIFYFTFPDGIVSLVSPC